MKTAFVLSGGGARGAFQVGALNYLVRVKKIIPNIVTGISTGSLQAVGLTLDPSCELLNEVWSSIKRNQDIYTASPFNYLKCLLGKRNGLYEFDGLRKILNKYFDKKKLEESPIDCFVGYVSLQDNLLTYSDKYTLTIDDIVASCTIPIAFPPVEKGNVQLVDGGVRDIVPLKKAIDEGATDIYVILCSPTELESSSVKYKTLIDVIMRTTEILLNEVFVNDIKRAEEINKRVKENVDSVHKLLNITLIQPDREVIGTLEFNPEKIKKAIDYGYQKASEVVK